MKCSVAALRQYEGWIRRQGFSVLGTQPGLRPGQPTVSRCCRNASLSWWSGRSYATVSAAELEFGQPVHETHPHILKAGEVTRGITAQEYFERRATLAQNLPERNDVAVLAAAETRYRSGAVFYPYRQESNFLYLTGFLEPRSLAVIQKTGPNWGDFSFHLFCRPKDPKAELWSGPWSGLQAAQDVFNADEAHDIHQVETILPGLLRGAGRVYTDMERNDATLEASVRGSSVCPLRPLVNQQRVIKSPAEVANMREAGRQSGRALTEAMRRAWTGERELAGFLSAEYLARGLDGSAYVPVVAGGRRGCLIHYVRNDAALRPDDTVLVDAGGEYGWYASDITRTWPLSGAFSPPQRHLYEVVLRVQRVGVAMCVAGQSLDQIHRATEAGLRSELARLGFPVDAAALEVLFPHHVGHYVGLDVHDVPGYPRTLPLKPGHCVTVEPGVYVPDDPRFPKHFRGLAVRIEDSVCVDEDTPLVLTTEAVKDIVDIEALRNSAVTST